MQFYCIYLSQYFKLMSRCWNISLIFFLNFKVWAWQIYHPQYIFSRDTYIKKEKKHEPIYFENSWSIKKIAFHQDRKSKLNIFDNELIYLADMFAAAFATMWIFFFVFHICAASHSKYGCFFFFSWIENESQKWK